MTAGAQVLTVIPVCYFWASLYILTKLVF